ncbi:DNA/RNA non-specific endonuclease [Rhizobium sp. 007]|uniref:DNA/RNA non-specific endonuclease n=1 Tax=Rhizobium sp. 007 TaxID=2785056 RepID=UPI001FEFF0C1|nr:DNA/RNA non-specific endonuclease [Rhizobium sp. 007]
MWTAVNIDGSKVLSTKSRSWRRDDRLPASEQTLADIYGKVPGKGVQIDRGHLVRRLDPVWGDQDVADRAGDDTFHYTNAAPQEHVYNSEIWGNLEDFVLARADKKAQRVSVMAGPILRPDDDFFGKTLPGGPWQVPWSFWKVAVFKREDKTVSVTGFVVEQTANIALIFESTRYNPYTVEQARVYQRPVHQPGALRRRGNRQYGKQPSADHLACHRRRAGCGAFLYHRDRGCCRITRNADGRPDRQDREHHPAWRHDLPSDHRGGTSAV